MMVKLRRDDMMQNYSLRGLVGVKIYFIALISVLLTMLFSSGAQAAGACSASIGKVNLNEYNYIDNFTEIKKIDSTINLTGWTVTIYTPTKTTVKLLPVTGSSNCFGNQYQVNTFASNEIGTNADAVLKDSNGDIVDFLRVRTSLPVTTTYYGALPACTFVGASTDLLVSSGQKGVDRLPDGTGDWRQTPGTGSNSFQSQCGPNIVGGSTDMSVSKTVSPSTVVKGTNVTFTLTVVNNGTGAASNVLVNDPLPAGFSYVSSSATVGTYASSTGVWTIGNMAVGATATLTLTATTTLVGTLTNTATVASSTFDPTTANNTSSVNVTVTSPGATLDAVEVTAAAGTAINTKLAGTAFNLDILALATDGSIATTYNKTVTIELVNAGTGASCSVMPLLQSVATYTFTGSGGGKDNGRKTYSFNYPSAAANVRVRMKDNSATPITACSTDNFSIRPTTFTVTSTDATNNAATGTPVIKAGTNFNLTATAIAGYGGTPLIDSAKIVGTATAGTLAGSFAAANSTTGIATGSTFTYSEVGNFGLNTNAIYDNNFTSIDQPSDCTADFSNTLVGGKYGCNIGSVAVPQTTGSSGFGRFIPDHFDTTVTGPMTCPSGLSCPTGGLVYSGQAFTVQITAKNALCPAGLCGTTQNYSGSYAKAVTLNAYDSAGGATSTPGSGTLTLNTMLATAFAAGVATTATPVYTFPTTPVLPTDIFIRATDADSVTSLRGVASVEGGVKVVSGRFKISNAYGSELLPLPMTATVQFYNPSGSWVTSTSDNLTAFNTSTNLVVSIVTGPLASVSIVGAGPVTVAGGVKAFTLNKPLVTGSADISFSAPSYLLAGSNTAAVNPTVKGRATFGVYSGNNNLIYQRESY
jgi:MSHA biogenesis protein MshQ